MTANKPTYKRICIDLEPDVRKIVVGELTGKMGKTPPEVIKAIIRIYLTERGYFR